MAIVFERSKNFEEVDYFYKNLALNKLVGKSFGSLEEALRQTTNVNGKDVLLSKYFKVDIKTVVPKNLPIQIREAYIV